MRVDCKQCPDQGREDGDDIDAHEEVALEAKLLRWKCEIETEVEREGEGNEGGEAALHGAEKDVPKGDGDDRVEDSPDGTEDPRWRYSLDADAFPVPQCF